MSPSRGLRYTLHGVYLFFFGLTCCTFDGYFLHWNNSLVSRGFQQVDSNVENFIRLRISEVRNEMIRELNEKMAELQRKFDVFCNTQERAQAEHHKENRLRLQSIDHTSRNNGQAITETQHIANNLAARMNLLFDEKGEGYFNDLKKEVRSLNNKITYATGVAVGAYIMVNFIKAHFHF